MITQNKSTEKQTITIDEKINKTDTKTSDKINNFFEKIDFLEMSPEKKASTAIQVKQDAKGNKLYWIEIFLSGIIAALGLLINSVAVVIGAMLIAPLLRPMNGISFSIALGEKKFFYTSVKIMFLSILLSIFTGFIAILITGLEIETTEILSRTTPNIIDLFIAIFSAMVAVLSLRFEKLSESVAGVAMAAALMPPLAVVGIELALGHYELSFGAFTLFSANLLAIIFVGIIFFWLYGFNPNDGKKQKVVLTRLLFVIFIIILISIPLLHSLYKIKQQINIKKTTNIILENTLKQKTNNYKIKNLEIKKITDNKITISSTISIPENLEFYETFKNKLIKNLKEELNKNIELNIELIRTANFLSEDYKKPDLKQELLDNLKNTLNERLEEKNRNDREILKKEIVDEIRKIFKEQNLKVVKVKKIKTGTGEIE